MERPPLEEPDVSVRQHRAAEIDLGRESGRRIDAEEEARRALDDDERGPIGRRLDPVQVVDTRELLEVAADLDAVATSTTNTATVTSIARRIDSPLPCSLSASPVPYPLVLSATRACRARFARAMM
ncbi:MAG: hypothetical protein H0W16_04955 [Actinobacteria bacterium]|nr:hypothetical protein [Actinomycetota bacterium]